VNKVGVIFKPLHIVCVRKTGVCQKLSVRKRLSDRIFLTDSFWQNLSDRRSESPPPARFRPPLNVRLGIILKPQAFLCIMILLFLFCFTLFKSASPRPTTRTQNGWKVAAASSCCRLRAASSSAISSSVAASSRCGLASWTRPTFLFCFSWTLHASLVPSKQQWLPRARARALQCKRPCWQKSLPLPGLTIVWSDGLELLWSRVLRWFIAHAVTSGVQTTMASPGSWLGGLPRVGGSLLGAAALTAAILGISGGLELLCSKGLSWVIACVGGIQANNNGFPQLLVGRAARFRRGLCLEQQL
jgi:hypothetical protein